ncbi:RNase H-like domain found in reverse transcriptase [Popillia japonica]|uniref:RNase H-like domain found in reverse transcriptase n=1 Tax=Popillia japonica TaxID=7064 RepID=A0AAW1JUX2_POPJA
MENCKGSSIPIDSKLKFGSCVRKDDIAEKPFRELVGCLMYLMTGSRPDTCYSVNHFSKYQDKASVERAQKHWFRVYLLEKKFKIVTDGNSLKTIRKKRDLPPRIARWVLKLHEYQFSIEHRPGNRMLHAAALSRNPNGDARTTEVGSEDILTVRIEDHDWVLTRQLQDKRLVYIPTRNIGKKNPEINDEKQIHHYHLDNNFIFSKVDGELN